MKKYVLAMISIPIILASCTWVKPTLKGSEVRFFDQTTKSFNTCKKLGTITTEVKHKIGFFNRSESKVDTELITAAKNEAAEMGGDTITAEGSAENGRRSFLVYECLE